MNLLKKTDFCSLSNNLDPETATGDRIFIVNPQADPESYIEDVFKIDQLESLNDSVATFGLISWLQYFRNQVPKENTIKILVSGL